MNNKAGRRGNPVDVVPTRVERVGQTVCRHGVVGRGCRIVDAVLCDCAPRAVDVELEVTPDGERFATDADACQVGLVRNGRVEREGKVVRDDAFVCTRRLGRLGVRGPAGAKDELLRQLRLDESTGGR